MLLQAYADALEQYLLTGQLAKLVNEAKGSAGPTTETNPATAEVTTLPKVKVPAYESSSEMIQSATQSCVTILTDAGHGSGFIVSENGMVITAQHVVAGANRVEVQLASGVKFDAQVIAEDESHDVALLSIPGAGYKVLPMGDSKAMGPGADAFTIGTPFEVELGQSVSKGIVSGKRKVEEIIYIQTDVSVSPGNSGGPLINSKGECVGIIQRKLVAMGVEGVGFALPIETALKQLGITLTE
jgi:S1-C subfamily serine protease